MGKRYHCDYCDKTMVATPSVIKTHNKGIVHQKLVQEHYQHFKDAETILAEEDNKTPCSRFLRGDCQFGSICRYSHYTREEINALREYVASKNQPQLDTTVPSFQELYHQLQNERSHRLQPSNDGDTIIYDSNGYTHVFPWVYNAVFDGYGDDLPLSIKRWKTEDFAKTNINTWG